MPRRGVLATIAYYDALEYPMTEFEVWKHLLEVRSDEARVNTPTLGEVAATVDDLSREGVVWRHHGFVVFPHREGLVTERVRGEKYAVSKIRRAAALARRVAWVPFVRMIALTGSLSMKRGDQGSDWDFFVVLAKGAIWRGRTMLSLVLQLMGRRRHGRYIENRACLNHFITDGSLEVAMQDFFSASEYRFMYTLFGREPERQFEIANRWIARVKPTYALSELPNVWLRQESKVVHAVRDTLERLLAWRGWERWLSRWQKQKIDENPKTHLPGAFIVANDKALIFLPRPRGPEVFERFKERLALYGFSS